MDLRAKDQAVQESSEAVVYVKGWKPFRKPGAPGPLSLEALVVFKMAGRSPIERRR
ncbi:MAG: hypothetical protein EWM73_01511 [Nitrospira sp.]|nr:MAG: hypothetical protein EWM73_01511 [Nitrospira sp.]